MPDFSAINFSRYSSPSSPSSGSSPFYPWNSPLDAVVVEANRHNRQAGGDGVVSMIVVF